jgi:HemY protein
MKRIILFFLLVLVVTWLGLQIYKQPGYIVIFYRHWSIETTVWFLVLSILVVFFLLYFLLNLLRETAYLPNRLQNWWQDRKDKQAIRLLNKGYLNWLTGHWKQSEKNLLKSSGRDDLSFISYLLAADAADQQHDQVKRDNYLQNAKKQAGRNSYIADALQSQFLLKHNQPEAALQLLLTLRSEQPKDPFLLRLLAKTYVELKDWQNLQLILADIKKYQVFDERAYLALEKEAYLHTLKDQYHSNFEAVQTIWNKMPKTLRQDPDILVAYAIQLNRWHRSQQAEELIRKQLKKNFDNRLMEYYAATRSKVPSKQLALSEKFLKANNDDPTSLRAMGFLCLRNRLWGQAKDYLERSLNLQPATEVYSALGYIYEKLGEHEKALIYYRKGLKAFL